MKISQIGNTSNKTLMLLAGTFCDVENTFKKVIPILKDEFNLVCVSYDGFSKTENSEFASEEFTTIIEQVEKIESYIAQNHQSKIHAIYGSSLGGSLVGLLVSRNKIEIKHAILGSSDLDQNNKLLAWIKTQIVTAIAHPIIKTGKISKLAQKTIFRKASQEELNKLVEILSPTRPWLSKKSCKLQFYSDLITKLPENIENEKTTIHILYAKKMGEKYLSRYKKHFPNAIIHENNYKHEELLYAHPEEFCEVIKSIL